MSLVLYGIPNCDTVKKARRWLDKNGVDYRFHDFRKDGLQATLVRNWMTQVGMDTLLNRRGTTWRQLDTSDKENLDPAAITALMLEYPALIKRPVLVKGAQVRVGFDEDDWQSLL